jgi:hypothetical protein
MLWSLVSDYFWFVLDTDAVRKTVFLLPGRDALFALFFLKFHLWKVEEHTNYASRLIANTRPVAVEAFSLKNPCRYRNITIRVSGQTNLIELPVTEAHTVLGMPQCRTRIMVHFTVD